MAVTSDKYELPIYVGSNAKELAEHFGVSINNVYSSISHKSTGRYRGYKFVKVKEI
jgi:hypothetical protein